MTNDDLKTKIESILPDATYEESTEWLTLNTIPEGFKIFTHTLRNDPALQFDFLFCVTAIDWKTHFHMVYHFRSTTLHQTLVVKVLLDKTNPTIDTVCDIWRTAEFHEREAYDLMGITFNGHPDLRRLFLEDEHTGFPLRKDYEDAINMIKL
ncbi:NADH-quinone oxidoreductase subunit C [soil metagenome]